MHGQQRRLWPTLCAVDSKPMRCSPLKCLPACCPVLHGLATGHAIFLALYHRRSEASSLSDLRCTSVRFTSLLAGLHVVLYTVALAAVLVRSKSGTVGSEGKAGTLLMCCPVSWEASCANVAVIEK